MSERLQKFLARSGVASRRQCETLIAAGRVSVNGRAITEPGTKVEPSDRVSVDGREVTPAQLRSYYLLHKPAGVMTTLSDPQGRRTVRDLLTSVAARVFPVGRLDFDAEGALLLTDDGELSQKLTHPKFERPRTYLAKVKGEPTDAALAKLVTGIRLEDGLAKATRAERFERAGEQTWVLLVVTEGRNHLVKRLCAAIGHPVVRLYRPSHAGLSVEGLSAGSFRALSEAEVAAVKAFAEGEPPSAEVALRLPEP